MAQLPLSFAPKKVVEKKEPSGPGQVWSVSELQSSLRGELERKYRQVWVEGEISNFQIHQRSGHAYFSLVDSRATIKGVMWRDNVRRLPFLPKDGDQVLAKGKVTIYEKGGSLQLSVTRMESTGLGAKQQIYLKLLETLKSEGLTDSEYKRPLPPFPRTIGLVTSESGAALRDVVRTIWRRDLGINLVLSAAPVQGAGSAALIAEALEELDSSGLCEVILIVRGGGSIEDLWSFNEEVVARAVAGCNTPTITGVGHETDTTAVDVVSDCRASTPTAAAEMAVPAREELLGGLAALQMRLKSLALAQVRGEALRLQRLKNQLRHPQNQLLQDSQRLDLLSNSLHQALKDQLQGYQRRILEAKRGLAGVEPTPRYLAAENRLQLAKQGLMHSMEARLQAARQRHGLAAASLSQLSPLAVLARGYSVTRDVQSKEVLRSSQQAKLGQKIEVQLAEGSLEAKVSKTVE